MIDITDLEEVLKQYRQLDLGWYCVTNDMFMEFLQQIPMFLLMTPDDMLYNGAVIVDRKLCWSMETLSESYYFSNGQFHKIHIDMRSHRILDLGWGVFRSNLREIPQIMLDLINNEV